MSQNLKNRETKKLGRTKGVIHRDQHVVTNAPTFNVCVYTFTCAGDSQRIDDHEKKRLD